MEWSPTQAEENAVAEGLIDQLLSNPMRPNLVIFTHKSTLMQGRMYNNPKCVRGKILRDRAQRGGRMCPVIACGTLLAVYPRQTVIFVAYACN